MRSLSEELIQLRDLVGEEGISFRELARDLEYRGHALMGLVLPIPFLFPIPLPGLSTPIGFVLMAVGIAILLQVPPWLPFGLAEKRLGRDKLHTFVEKALPYVQRVEKLLRPRWLLISVRGEAVRLHGFVISLCAALLALPAPPGGNVLPASAIILVSMGLLEEDGLAIILGYLMLLGSIAYFATIATVVLSFF